MSVAFLPPRKSSTPCFDAGSRYCPCDLAFLGQCVACSLIRGEDACRCGWSGMCVYQEFLRRKDAAPHRKAWQCTVVDRTDLAVPAGQEGAFIVEIAVPREVAEWCVFPGSFIMLRPDRAPERFNVPLSVMKVKDEAVTVAVEVRGPKTIALSGVCAKEGRVTAVGPFWSGLQGSANLKRFAGGRVLAIAKGIGQAPLLNAAHYVLGHGGSFKALLGPGVLGEVFTADLLRAEGANVEVLPRSKDHNLARFYSELCQGGYDLLISEGSDQQHRSLGDLLSSMDEPPAFAWSSNLSMTCAEGICGSCLVSGHRGCKSDLAPAEIPGS